LPQTSSLYDPYIKNKNVSFKRNTPPCQVISKSY
jgi:hypothetical protein